MRPITRFPSQSNPVNCTIKRKVNEWAAETCAKARAIYYSGGTSGSASDSVSDSWGSNSGSSGGWTSGGSSSSSSWGSSHTWSRSRTRSHSSNDGWQEQMDYQVQPEWFTRLKSGGKRHKYQVEAIVYKSGAAFHPSGRPFTGVTFSQR